MNQEGYIKFNCLWEKTDPVPEEIISDINYWRDVMYRKKLIGMYPDGIGFGNISIRLSGKTFLISGTATGGIEKLNAGHYVKVEDYDLKKNELTCRGPVKASSESLSHAVIYECSPETMAVIHIHNFELWEKLLHHFPTTAKEIPYGTPEMAMEIKRLFSETKVTEEKIIVMEGHPEGIITFGKTPEEAGSVLLSLME